MLSNGTKLEIQSELFRGNIGPLLYRLQHTDQKAYLEACTFAMSELKRVRRLPADQPMMFYITQSPEMGPFVNVNPLSAGSADRMAIQGHWHPSELEADVQSPPNSVWETIQRF
jgi:hypothetical protein